ncbi:MAG TPA: TSUP family transporter [Prosthecobacter sp.]|nr:TSUP family transporter [Prosthecobacter sp.]
MTAATVLLLFGAGLGAGFIDAIAGGGGLISVPALLWAGLPPQIALGTNKMQSTWGTLLAVRRYAQAGLIHWRQVRLAVAVTFVAALAGTFTVTLVSNEVLKRIVPWMLLTIAAYTLLSPRLGRNAVQARLSPAVFAVVAGCALGFYDGFFGPGVGSFWTIACLSLLGLELTRATAYTKVVNLTSNFASLIVFVFADRIRYDVAAVMIAGQLVGARLGSGLVIQHGARFIRVVFIAVVLAMVVKLLWDQFGG